MTPTLIGRWQTRVFLMLVLGGPLTLLFMLVFGAFNASDSAGVFKLPLLLAYVIAIGFVWDWLWIYLQGWRWDRDWPLAFQFASGVVEGFAIFGLFAAGVLPGITFADGDAVRFSLHYGTIFWVTYWFMLGPMRVVFPRWRFRGGRIV